jgi:HEAT repeat protein
MEGKTEHQFYELIQELAGDRPLSVPMLFMLSDLAPEELEKLCAAWPDINPKRRGVIARHLADITEENYEVDFSDIFAFCLQDSSMPVRLASLDGLWDSDKVALIRPIIALMREDPEVDVRRSAAATLGHYVLMAEWNQIPRHQVEPITDALLEQLDSPEVDVRIRRAALESLGASSHPRIPALIGSAYDSGEAGLQLSAVYAMGQSADNRWLPIVRDEMGSPLSEMRLEAARASGVIADSDAVPELAELIWDEDLEVRLAAVNALGQIGSDLAREILESLAMDEDAEELREAIEESLEEMDWLGGQIDLSLLDWDNSHDD